MKKGKDSKQQIKFKLLWLNPLNIFAKACSNWWTRFWASRIVFRPNEIMICGQMKQMQQQIVKQWRNNMTNWYSKWSSESKPWTTLNTPKRTPVDQLQQLPQEFVNEREINCSRNCIFHFDPQLCAPCRKKGLLAKPAMNSWFPTNTSWWPKGQRQSDSSARRSISISCAFIRFFVAKTD